MTDRAMTCLVVLATIGPGCQGKSGAPKASPTKEDTAPAAKAAPVDYGLRPDGPKVRFGELLVEGPRDGGALLGVISENVGRFQDCYAKTLADKPDVAGELGIRFFVTNEGKVPDAILANAKITDRPLQRCLMGAFKALSFPPVEGGDGTRATLPVFFGEVAAEPAKPDESAKAG